MVDLLHFGIISFRLSANSMPIVNTDGTGTRKGVIIGEFVAVYSDLAWPGNLIRSPVAALLPMSVKMIGREPPHSPTLVRVLTVHGATGANAWQAHAGKAPGEISIFARMLPT